MKKKINFLLVALSCFILLCLYWGRITYDDFKIEQLIFQLKVNQNGLDYNIIKSFIYTVIIPFIIITLTNLFFLNDNFNKLYYEITIINRKFNISVVPKKLILCGVIIFLSSFSYTCYNIEVPQYLKNNITSSSFIEQNYVKPENIKFNNKKNLIHIYVESFESTYTDKINGGYETYNLIPNLSNLNGINFSHHDKFGGMLETYGTTWTVAALVSQTSGIPLNIPIQQNLYNNKNAKFFYGVISIGDI